MNCDEPGEDRKWRCYLGLAWGPFVFARDRASCNKSVGSCFGEFNLVALLPKWEKWKGKEVGRKEKGVPLSEDFLGIRRDLKVSNVIKW